MTRIRHLGDFIEDTSVSSRSIGDTESLRETTHSVLAAN